MSHRYASGVLQNDWNDPDFRSLDRSQRGCCIWVSLCYKTVNIVVSSLYYLKNLKSVTDSAVLLWTTRLMVFSLNVGFGRCYLVSTRHEILSNIDRNAKPNRNSAAAPKNPKRNKSRDRESTDPIPVLLLSLEYQTVVFQPFDFHLRMFKKFIIKTPHPLPALFLEPFLARSLTLVPHSLLLNRTETLATQVIRY